MNKLTIKIPLFCTAALLTLGLNTLSYAEESTTVSSSDIETTRSNVLSPAQNSTDESTMNATEEETQSSTTTSETTEESTETQAVNSSLYFDDYFLPSNRSDLNPTIQSRSITPALSMDVVNAGEANRPSSHFIDISSHNGSISVANFQKMKNYGIKGVVVKLTESTSYVNPYAQEQINNATAAGLKVSAYHYAHYTSSAIASSEANYFASLANTFRLPKSTVMVIDIEEGKMLNGSLTPNTTSFVNVLKANGFSNIMYYMNRTYATSGHFSVSTFGAKNMWVAQYPYTPTAGMNWNNEFSSWQWSSQYYIPGIAHPFDISMDYTGYLENGAQGKWLSANQYVTITKKNYSIWSNFNFNSALTNTTNIFNKTYKVTGKYQHMNGSTYYSLYDNNGNWKGYVNAEATTKANGAQGLWLSENKYVTLTKKSQTIWGDINTFSSKKGSTSDHYQKTFKVSGKYNHANGAVYYSLYDNNGKWIGYINSDFASSASGPQGTWLSENKYVTFTKKGQTIWGDINTFSSKKGNTTDLYQKTYKVSGKYNHIAGAVYYSLYDNNNKWVGYINANGPTVAPGPQGTWLSNNDYVTITKKNTTLWGDINNFSSKKGNTTDIYQQTFHAKGKYNHIANVTYYSLYDNDGKWIGYLNSSAATVAPGSQGIWIKNDEQVKINKKDYTIWSEIDTFSAKKGNTTEIYGETYHAKGIYHHFSGASYYSLYDNTSGKWIGYLNTNATIVTK
ncbi:MULTISPECIES: GH25 family lysozyme [unclassified Enterococcus]|uniref:GH25 family lysozyme n=1 Tax=unclassified Enterococcus TaxID=2608891 RepID=UPI001CE1FA11|nr:MULTISPECIES: GH25 family lysozyme [unclassified Enterococcus]MCA5012461.1 lysozyme [Enterococcus sp. S23]MCA5015712.1 lysozyme [Enterococcus sp. S22(2020)]